MADDTVQQYVTWQDFPEFYANEIIQQLAHECRWTISATQPIDATNAKTGKPYVLPAKSPLDVRELTRSSNIRGAWSLDEQCLMTLDELNANFGGAVNNAFHLSAQIDGVVVLDIEPTCPPRERDLLLALPALYREASMSGKGYHLVMPLPKNFDDFPVAAGKRKLQHQSKWYEILIDHWVTFTRQPIPEPNTPQTDQISWEDVYADLAEEAIRTTKAEFDLDTEMPEMPLLDIILRVVTEGPEYKRTVDDFSGDYSKWEYGQIGFLYNRLLLVLDTKMISEARDWSDSDQAWLLYEAARRVLPPRDKHLTMRVGMPFLLYCAIGLIAERRGSENQNAWGSKPS